MTDFVTIDGRMGGGGGQVLRTALAFSAATGKPLRLENVRAQRAKPGFVRRHLAAIKAAAAICGAEVRGGALSSQSLEFIPGEVVSGPYEFSVGSAYSAVLAAQVVLPAMFSAGGAFDVVFNGGTHTAYAPPYDFLVRSYLPSLEAMGASFGAVIESYGFFPAGGGRFSIHLSRPNGLKPYVLNDRGLVLGITAKACVARLSSDICQRELKHVREHLGLKSEDVAVETGLASHCCGNYLFVEVRSEQALACFTGFGVKDRPAEEVASMVVQEVHDYLSSGAPVEKCLADQLVAPMALARGGCFRTMHPNRHLEANLELAEAFTSTPFALEKENESVWRVILGERQPVIG